MNGSFHASSNGGCPAQVTTLLFGFTTCQVTGATLTVHAFAIRSDAKAFLRAFVGFDLGTHRLFIQSIIG